jgi:dihydroorotase
VLWPTTSFTGGRVIDPAQNLSAERDVAIAGGRIARIAASIPPAQARQVYDAKGKIVTPD